MMWRILLLAATVHGAAIPQNPSCLEKCLVAGGIVGAAADLNFFKSVAVDINNFCNVYTALLKCASGCSQDDLNLVMKHTMHASYVCKEKLEEIKTVHDCLESDTTDPLSDCGKVCEVTEHVPLRLDSTATAPVNPNVPAEGTGPLCGKQMCVLKCAREQLNKQCAGAGDLFKEIARHQVEIGWDMLQAQSENTNDTASQLVALSYLANIPEKCVYLTNLETFDKEIGGDMNKKPEMMPGSEFSNDTMVETESSGSLAAAMDAPTESMAGKMEEGVHEQPKPAEAPVAGATDESMDEAAESVDASGDKESAMGPRPTSGPSVDVPGGGLIASRPVTEEDKDKEEEEEESGMGEMAKSTDAKTASAEGGKTEEKAETSESDDEAAEGEKSETDEAAMAKSGESMDGKTEEAKVDEEEADTVGDAVEKEIEEGAAENKDGEGAEMSTDATIVVDDENESELEKNEITEAPVTEKAKVNAAGSVSIVAPLAALAAVMFL